MATTPAYWPSSPSSSRGNTRRASDGTPQHLMYSPYAIPAAMYPARASDSSDEHRSPSSGSSGTSSLTGAMGDWAQTPMLAPLPPYAGSTYLDAPAPSYYHGDSPESLSPPSPFSAVDFNDPFPSSASASYPTTTPTTSAPYPPISTNESEVRRLRKRLRDLEQTNHRAQEQIKVLESRLQRQQRMASHSPPMAAAVMPPSPSPSFMSSWQTRTDARVRMLCSLNRAGNALCAWHDSRRERRVHPPRMAPAGYLNCGCTYEEALFEESLSRHHVGSYLPGETVRMDPALRNPLLKLLQQRYGYKDGDFERDPVSGRWVTGEGPELWEGNGPNPRRERR
ncbi:hypothetical protein MKEN_00601300 [Mycena kentingensis (nom. inval.)]|nr:hypothetical protein MKEN_00601300 [Mycena kentingensis (nom. inval.)]